MASNTMALSVHLSAFRDSQDDDDDDDSDEYDSDNDVEYVAQKEEEEERENTHYCVGYVDDDSVVLYGATSRFRHLHYEF